jgi:trimeric autotransporter adhesin
VDTIVFSDSIDGISATDFGYLDATSSIQSQIDSKASIVSPDLSGNPTCVTQLNTDNSTRVANTAYVHTAIGDLVNGSAETLDTLAEIANAINDDVNFSTTMTNLIGTKLTTSTYTSETLTQDNRLTAIEAVDAIQTTNINLKANVASPTFTGTVSGINKAMVGLSGCDNTSDASKPISTSQQTALDLNQILLHQLLRAQ